jgi:hypothetical protein
MRIHNRSATIIKQKTNNNGTAAIWGFSPRSWNRGFSLATASSLTANRASNMITATTPYEDIIAVVDSAMELVPVIVETTIPPSHFPGIRVDT